MFTWRNQSLQVGFLLSHIEQSVDLLLQGIPEQQTMTLVVQSSAGENSTIQVNWMGVFDEFYPLNITDGIFVHSQLQNN